MTLAGLGHTVGFVCTAELKTLYTYLDTGSVLDASVFTTIFWSASPEPLCPALRGLMLPSRPCHASSSRCLWLLNRNPSVAGPAAVRNRTGTVHSRCTCRRRFAQQAESCEACRLTERPAGQALRLLEMVRNCGPQLPAVCALQPGIDLKVRRCLLMIHIALL